MHALSMSSLWASRPCRTNRRQFLLEFQDARSKISRTASIDTGAAQCSPTFRTNLLQQTIITQQTPISCISRRITLSSP